MAKRKEPKSNSDPKTKSKGVGKLLIASSVFKAGLLAALTGGLLK